jgi:hypothetical protein
MPPSSTIRTLALRVPRNIQTRRYAAHGAPQYNEPTGWLFGEKVGSGVIPCISADSAISEASSTGSEASERRVGEYMVHWDAWFNGPGRSFAILQA